MLDDRIHDVHPNEHLVTALVGRLRCHEWMVVVDEDVDGVVLGRLTEVIGIPLGHVLRMVDAEGPWPYFDDAWFDLWARGRAALASTIAGSGSMPFRSA